MFFKHKANSKLPKKIEKVIDKNKDLNKEYAFTIYTDEQIHDFIKSNYEVIFLNTLKN